MRVIVYLITNKITNKKYVGITTTTLNKRWLVHVSKNSCCRYLKHSIQKYGKENFKIEEIFQTFDQNYVNEIENYFIQYYQTIAPNGYNLRAGGQFGKFSEQAKERCSVAQKKNWEDQDRRNYYSNNMKEQWKNCELREQRSIGLIASSQKKKKPICGKSIKTNEIIKFESLLEAKNAGYYDSNITLAIKNNKPYRGFMWFYL